MRLYEACARNDLRTVESCLLRGEAVNFRTKRSRRTSLFIAASRGHDRIVSALLRAHADVSLSAECNKTPLSVALISSHKSIVRQLLSASVKAKVPYSSGDLMLACMQGFVAEVKALMRATPVESSASYQSSLLVLACKEGFLSEVRMFLRTGLSVNYANDYRDAPLAAACKNGHTAIVTMLLNAGANPNYRDRERPLVIACKRGDSEIVESLLLAGADPSSVTRNDSALFNDVCKLGHAQVVKKLLSRIKGINLNTEHSSETSIGNTPVFNACLNGHMDVVTHLLDAGADAWVKNSDDWTSLHAACKGKSSEIVRVLLSLKGVDINARAKPKVKRYGRNIRIGITPLHLACEHADVEMVSLLLGEGADPSLTCVDGWTPLHAACKAKSTEIVEVLLPAKGVNINSRSDNKESNYSSNEEFNSTPLLIACSNADLETLQALVSGGVDLNLGGADGVAPLYVVCHQLDKERQERHRLEQYSSSGSFAASTGKESNVSKMLDLFLSVKGVDVNAVNTAIIKFGYSHILKPGTTLLNFACQCGDVETVLKLLGKGANTSLACVDGWAPLHAACHAKFSEIVDALLQTKGVNVNSKTDRKGGSYYGSSDGSISTPLLIACSAGNLELVKTLMSAGADPNLKGADGMVPLQVAYLLLEGGRVRSEVFEFMLSVKGINLNAVSTSDIRQRSDIDLKAGASLLLLACQQKDSKMVSLLLAKGANPNLACIDGWTPLHAACQVKSIEIVIALLDGKEINVNPRAGTKVKSGYGSRKGSISTPLLIACSDGSLELVKILICAGVDPNLAGSNGMVPLQVAYVALKERSARDYGRASKSADTNKVFELLLSADGININAVSTSDDMGINFSLDFSNTRKSGSSLLMLACQKNDSKMVSLLLTKGADPNLACVDGWTPLHAACQGNFSEVLDELLQAKEINLNLKASRKLELHYSARPFISTPLLIACKFADERMVSQLIDAGADLCAAEVNGLTLLHVVSKRGEHEILTRLLSLKCLDVNVITTDVILINNKEKYEVGTTPLDVALEYKHYEVAHTLLSHGATLGLKVEATKHLMRSVFACGQLPMFVLLLSKLLEFQEYKRDEVVKLLSNNFSLLDECSRSERGRRLQERRYHSDSEEDYYPGAGYDEYNGEYNRWEESSDSEDEYAAAPELRTSTGRISNNMKNLEKYLPFVSSLEKWENRRLGKKRKFNLIWLMCDEKIKQLGGVSEIHKLILSFAAPFSIVNHFARNYLQNCDLLLWAASKKGCALLLHELLRNNAGKDKLNLDLNIAAVQGNTRMRQVPDCGTPLQVACKEGNPQIVSALLTARADVNLAMPNGSTPLSLVRDLARSYNRYRGHFEQHQDVEQMLIEAGGIDPNDYDAPRM